MESLSQNLVPNGKWIMTDFQTNNILWQRLLIKLMYSFFRVTTKLEGNELLDFDHYFRRLDYSLAHEKSWYSNMIVSRVYER